MQLSIESLANKGGNENTSQETSPNSRAHRNKKVMKTTILH